VGERDEKNIGTWHCSIFPFLYFAFIDGVIGSFRTEAGIRLPTAVFALAMLTPSPAISVRRLHDSNRSGCWMLFCAIPCIGDIVIPGLPVQNSQPGENKYGPNPKEAKGIRKHLI
jgi:uncharacterized membrane protein YhaH (DUF805 family)